MHHSYLLERHYITPYGVTVIVARSEVQKCKVIVIACDDKRTLYFICALALCVIIHHTPYYNTQIITLKKNGQAIGNMGNFVHSQMYTEYEANCAIYC